MADIFFFLHLPRTAGTTLNHILERNFAPQSVLSIYSREEYAGRQELFTQKQDKLRLILGHLLLEGFSPPRIFGVPVRPFTFLREPVARLTAEYRFLRSWKRNHLYGYLNDNNVSFRTYLTSDEQMLKYRGRNFMTRCVAGLDPGSADRPRAALAKAKRHLEKEFAFVGVQERFDESLLLLGETLGLSDLLYERRNAMASPEAIAFAPEDLDLARQMNRGDAELHAFALALLEEKIAAKGRNFAEKLREFRFLNEKFQRLSDLLRQKAGIAKGHDNLTLPKDGLW